MQPNATRSPSSRPAGFSLIEILVGLAISMFALLVIVQVMQVFEGQRRTTSGSADAQTNGSIALYTIGRELQLAGYPLMPVTDSPLECTTLTTGGVADTTNRLSPVTIVDGGAAAGASDTITLRYGNSLSGGIPVQITGAPAGNVVPVGSGFGCGNGDTSLIINGLACAMSVASPVAATTVTLADTTGAVANANLSCLGAWNEITYRANGGNLERCNLPTAIANGGNCNLVPLVPPNVNFVPNVAGIVNIQAQYGISAAANSNQVTQWVDATGIWDAPAVTVANRNRIKAVRIAVVARNAKMEPGNVTNPCNPATVAGLCAWAGVPAAGVMLASPAPIIDLSNDATWQRSRYRVFETIIPLRNVIWATRETLQ